MYLTQSKVMHKSRGSLCKVIIAISVDLGIYLASLNSFSLVTQFEGFLNLFFIDSKLPVYISSNSLF